MAKVQWPGAALLAPVPPALVTTGTLETPNICTVAWCGTLNTKPPKTYISLRPSRYSYELLTQNGEFALHLPTTSLVKTIDYCGVKSGRQEDKFAKCSLTLSPAAHIAPPIVNQSPLALECRVFDTVELGTHTMFLADILGVSVEETLIDEKGKLNLAKAGLAAYAHGEYFALGKSLGTFGYSVRKKPRKGHKK